MCSKRPRMEPSISNQSGVPSALERRHGPSGSSTGGSPELRGSITLPRGADDAPAGRSLGAGPASVWQRVTGPRPHAATRAKAAFQPPRVQDPGIDDGVFSEGSTGVAEASQSGLIAQEYPLIRPSFNRHLDRQGVLPSSPDTPPYSRAAVGRCDRGPEDVPMARFDRVGRRPPSPDQGQSERPSCRSSCQRVQATGRDGDPARDQQELACTARPTSAGSSTNSDAPASERNVFRRLHASPCMGVGAWTQVSSAPGSPPRDDLGNMPVGTVTLQG